MISQFKKYGSVIVTGSIAYDDIMVFPGYFKDFFHPEKLHQINVSFAVNSLVKHIGGTATNIAYSMRLFTKKNIHIIGAMGQDHERLTEFYTTHSLDFSGSYIDKKLYTATGKVITDQADNQIWGFYYGAAEKGNKVDFTPYSKGAFAIISANHENAFLHAQKYFIQKKIPYLYDPGMSLTWIKDHDLQVGIENAQFLVGNDYEIAQMLRRLDTSIEALKQKGIGVITTLGAEGVRFIDKDMSCIVSGYKVKSLKDPTGAGDAWRGGFVAALTNGLSIEESLKIANALASFAVEQYGTANHTPTVKDIQKRTQTLQIIS